MGRIPLPPTGNPQLDYALRIIDEQLSELYSQHGTQTPRENISSGTITLRDSLGSFQAMEPGRIYKDTSLIGLAYSASDGSILFSKNMRPFTPGATTSRLGVGDYMYSLISGADETNYVAIAVKIGVAFGSFNVYASVPSAGGGAIVVTASDAAAAALDTAHAVLVFGNLE